MLNYQNGLLTHAESCALLDVVERWCSQTATNYSKLMLAAGVAPSIRSHVRLKERPITEATAAKLQTAMEANPSGISKSQSKTRRREIEQSAFARVQATVVAIAAATHPIVDRTPCPWCNVRGDIGCRHNRTLSAAPDRVRVMG